tara:strand:+ start:267 stop:509 length:243 start_codon:yes stop_codon:yes gene_type:complete
VEVEQQMARKLKITVDLNVCVGNAMCETFATNTFALNDDRQSSVANPDGDPEEMVLEAAENCPVSAITVSDAESGEQLFP